ncbi:DUF2255 domain-containing protein [Serinibacter arcticus]|uniref:DUF2255 domain-containing protein n=1 Tax=Serinibacter arcticus TaxID=1655435 RepID=A0A2U1ZVQ0_9MICO|nr:DUF2255 family protein [Serinibacter arcticus]PWD51044.1 DUF2255 domain-containing protein [Serinibacter arcticus]
MSWTERELEVAARSDELEVSSRRSDGSLRPAVTIWVVRAGDDVVIRSASGPGNGWFRRAVTSGVGRVSVGGVTRDVAFELVDDGGAHVAWHAAVDAAYHAKYDRYGARIVGSVVGPTAATATLRVHPRG